jgi:hypothetical protein
MMPRPIHHSPTHSILMIKNSPDVTWSPSSNLVMNHQTKDFLLSLIKRITNAPSQDGVKQIIDAAMTVMGDHQDNISEKIQLAEKIVRTINNFHPVNYGPEEWSNIKMARIHFNSLKSKMKTETE